MEVNFAPKTPNKNSRVKYSFQKEKEVIYNCNIHRVYPI